jgi:hypothetical protein
MSGHMTDGNEQFVQLGKTGIVIPRIGVGAMTPKSKEDETCAKNAAQRPEPRIITQGTTCPDAPPKLLSFGGFTRFQLSRMPMAREQTNHGRSAEARTCGCFRWQ